VKILDPSSAVIVRLDRTIQYAAASRSFAGVSGILDPRFRGDDEKRNDETSDVTTKRTMRTLK
jgi:hypothetical protein